MEFPGEMKILWGNGNSLGFLGDFFWCSCGFFLFAFLVSASSQVQHFLLPQEVRVLNLFIFLWSPESINCLDLKGKFKIGQRQEHSWRPPSVGQLGEAPKHPGKMLLCGPKHKWWAIQEVQGWKWKARNPSKQKWKKTERFLPQIWNSLAKRGWCFLSQARVGVTRHFVCGRRAQASATGQENRSYMSLKSFTKDKLLSFHPSCPNIICVMLLQDIFILATRECCQPTPNTKGFWGSAT